MEGPNHRWVIVFLFMGGYPFLADSISEGIKTNPVARNLLQIAEETSKIHANARVSRTLEFGQVYFACASKDSLGVKNCMKYKFEADRPIISFVINRTIYEESRVESYADMDTFTFESILPNGECVGIGCSRRLDFRSDVDWCLVFANTGVPSLNFMKLKAEDAHFTYEFQTCIANKDLPFVILQTGAFFASLALTVSIAIWWMISFLGSRRDAPPKLLPSPRPPARCGSPPFKVLIGGYQPLPKSPSPPKSP